MKIIAQKSDILNSYEFFERSLSTEYIDGVSLNVALTEDNNIVIYNTPILTSAIINTIETSTLEQLQNYEIIRLDETLKSLNDVRMKKSIYLNVAPFRTSIINDDNIQEVTNRINLYVDELARIINMYPNLNINLHSVSRNFVTILKNKIKNHKVGFVVYGDDLTFIEVDYYVMTTGVFNDNIIDMLLEREKEVLLYVESDYYISYLYEHYFGKNSTAYLQSTFQKLSIISSYPEIINKVFNS